MLHSVRLNYQFVHYGGGVDGVCAVVIKRADDVVWSMVHAYGANVNSVVTLCVNKEYNIVPWNIEKRKW